MRQPPPGYKSAAAGVRRAFDDRAASSSDCRPAAGQAGRLLTRDLSLMAQEIAISDRVNNSATERKPYSGPAPVPFQARARRTISRDLAELRRLSGC